MKSIFLDKTCAPNVSELQTALDSTFELWDELAVVTVNALAYSISEWNFSGEKYGWSYRIKDKRRTIIYLLPRKGFFKVAFVFGERATDAIENSNINENIKAELRAARKYAEGRGIRIPVYERSQIEDIKFLITIKLQY